MMRGPGDGAFQQPPYYAVDSANVYAGDLNGDGILGSSFRLFRDYVTCWGMGTIRFDYTCSLARIISLSMRVLWRFRI
jgi:hypothetical protein